MPITGTIVGNGVSVMSCGRRSAESDAAGSGASPLSESTMARLKDKWHTELAEWRQEIPGHGSNSPVESVITYSGENSDRGIK